MSAVTPLTWLALAALAVTVWRVSTIDPEDLFLEPRPDEDAWEAFINLALERIGGERSPGLSNRKIGELEEVIGCQLPFEVGLLLVMGVPAADGWRQWQDPQAEFAEWNEWVQRGICHDVEHNDFWFDGWGAKPNDVADRVSAAADQFDATVPELFPVYRDHAVPLTAAEGQPNSDDNPVLLVHGATATRSGDDLAAWFHHQFEVPLPMWPAEDRTFPFWT